MLYMDNSYTRCGIKLGLPKIFAFIISVMNYQSTKAVVSAMKRL